MGHPVEARHICLRLKILERFESLEENLKHSDTFQVFLILLKSDRTFSDLLEPY